MKLPCGCVVGVGGERCPEAERLLNRTKRAYRKWAVGSDTISYAVYDEARERWWRHVTADNARE